MEGNNQFRYIYSKKCIYYYFNDIVWIEDFDINNILIDEKPCKNIWVYYISYISYLSSLIDSKLLRNRFVKMDRSIRVYDGTRYVKLFWSGKLDYVYSKIR